MHDSVLWLGHLDNRCTATTVLTHARLQRDDQSWELATACHYHGGDAQTEQVCFKRAGIRAAFQITAGLRCKLHNVYNF